MARKIKTFQTKADLVNGLVLAEKAATSLYGMLGDSERDAAMKEFIAVIGEKLADFVNFHTEDENEAKRAALLKKKAEIDAELAKLG